MSKKKEEGIKQETSIQNETEDAPVEKKKKIDPVKLFTSIILFLCLVIFIWHVWSDRQTPYTDQAKIKGLAIPISPRVSGYVTQINVRLHSLVKQGDTIFQIDKRPFELAVKSAEAKVDNAAQQVGARTATVKSAAGRLGMANAQLDRAQRNYNRVQTVLKENPGALSMSDRDQAETTLSQAIEQVASSEADLEKAEQQLGESGPENPQFRAAVVGLQEAQLNLAFSTIYAPADGAIESYNLDLGYYSQAGQSLAMFVSTTDLWIEADMKENNISNMEKGDKVEFLLDVEPGVIHEGTIRSIGYGVNSGYANRNELPNVKSSSGWLRDPQRFPVVISFDNKELLKYSRLGGQVDVVVYTGDNGFLNTIGRWRIRFNGWLSFIR
jgi:multidrug resistance efflux pump